MKKVVVTVILFFASFNFYLGAKSLMVGLDRIKQKVEKAVKDTSSMNFKDYCNQKRAAKAGSGESDGPKLDGQSLYWCNREDLVKALDAFSKQKDQAMVMLKNEIHKKYAKENTPILCFARDLLKEEGDIQSLMNQAVKDIQGIKEKDRLKCKSMEAFNRLTQQKATLLRLINIVENLLTS